MWHKALSSRSVAPTGRDECAHQDSRIAALQAAEHPPTRDPGRWPGLRNDGPSGLRNYTSLWAKLVLTYQ